MEGAVLAPLAARGAVPAAVVELLAEEIVDEVIEAASVVSVSGGKPHQHRGNAGLRDPPLALPFPEALASGQRRRISGGQTEPQQVKQCVRRRDPLRCVISAAPTPVGILQRDQLGTPALRRDLGLLGTCSRLRAAEKVSMHPPANRRVAPQQPGHQVAAHTSHRDHDLSKQRVAL